jgi:hypothetical protein
VGDDDGALLAVGTKVGAIDGTSVGLDVGWFVGLVVVAADTKL